LSTLVNKVVEDKNVDLKFGTVDVNGKFIDVAYRFISETDIECTNAFNFTFITHYKSLVCKV